jgi:hypothetical protein
MTGLITLYITSSLVFKFSQYYWVSNASDLFLVSYAAGSALAQIAQMVLIRQSRKASFALMPLATH